MIESWIQTALIVFSALLAPLGPSLLRSFINRHTKRSPKLPETVWIRVYACFLLLALLVSTFVLVNLTTQSTPSRATPLLTAVTIVLISLQVCALGGLSFLYVLCEVIRSEFAKLRKEVGATESPVTEEAPHKTIVRPPAAQWGTPEELAAPDKPSRPFPRLIPNITPIDLHAGIIAMAYRLHAKYGQVQNFTHVKAEKIAHMVEALVGINLGRTPIKDAAGPNDFRHLREVEHRARTAKFFDFQQVGKGPYKLRRLAGFDHLIGRTRMALGDRCIEVDRLLDWMLQMSVQQAEIVATVFSAWNNLLLEKKLPSDEEIVFEARENWHPNKLRIERKKFFAAVEWLREQKMVPQGKGKRVEGKLK